MITIIRKELQLLMKEKGAFFRLVVMPVIFVVLFSSVLGGRNHALGTPSRIAQVVPGFMVMFVFYVVLIMMRSFFRERDSGMLARLRSTPMKPLNYLMGMWVTGILTSLIQCTVLLAFGYFVYNLNLGDLSAVVPLVLALSICVTGVGLALSFLVGSESQGIAVTQVITIAGAFLAGPFMPFDSLPDFAQAVGYFTPQYWAQGAFQNLMSRGGHMGDVWLNLAVLLAFGAAGLIIALLRFKRFILCGVN